MVGIFYFRPVYDWYVASLGLVLMAISTLIFLGFIQISQSFKLITQLPCNIIKYISLLSLKIDNFLLINRLMLLSSSISS